MPCLIDSNQKLQTFCCSSDYKFGVDQKKQQNQDCTRESLSDESIIRFTKQHRAKKSNFTFGWAGCYFCGKCSKFEHIKEWVGIDAVCPHCGVDSMIIGPFHNWHLENLNSYWFSV